METFIVALQTVLPLFLIIFTGLLFSQTRAANEKWVEVLNKYALWIGFPALVIASLMHLDLEGESYLKLILINSGYIVICMLLAFPVAKVFGLSVKFRSSLFLILSFGNVAYLGIPVLNNAFGNEVLPVAAIISAVYVFWLLTLAILLIEIFGEGKTNVKKLGLSLAQNPLLLSVFIGIAIVVLKIKLPAFVAETIHLFADSVTAVILFSLGIFLGIQEIGRLKEWLQVAVLSLTTMLLLPFIFYEVINWIPLSSNSFKATVLDAAMPLGVTPYVLAVQYKLETTLVARIIVFGTLLSMFIIPLWMVFLG